MYFGYSGSMRTKPGQRDQVVQILLTETAELTEAGALAYIIGVREDDPDVITVDEVWLSAEHHRASLQLPRTQAAIAQAMPMLTGEFNGQERTVVGGLGLSPPR